MLATCHQPLAFRNQKVEVREKPSFPSSSMGWFAKKGKGFKQIGG